MANWLLVEDNDADVHLLREAFAEIGFRPSMRVVASADEALRIVRDTTGTAPPDVVLLDMNLPGTPGITVLDGIRTDRGLRQPRVIVLTSSTDEHDIAAARSLEADDYLIKPIDFDGYIELAERLRRDCEGPR